MGQNFLKINNGINFKGQSSPPSSPSNGDTYYDSTRNTLVEYINGNWRDVQSRSDVASASSLTSANFTASIVQSSFVRVTGSTTGNIHGLTASSGAKSLVIYNQSSVAQTLKSQSATEGTAANRIITPSGVDVLLLSGQSAIVVYDDSQSRWVVTGTIGSGSGSGSKNYLSQIITSQSSTPNTGNGDFEFGSTTGWSLGTTGTLTNGIPTGSPTFGSGASGNLSISAVNSGQLAGLYSLSYASSAATTQGNMLASDAFNIDTEDQAKVLTWQFYYKAQTNPGNADWSGTSSASFGVAIYDVTNSAWLPSTANFAMTQSSGVGLATGTCQTSTNTTQLRLVVYNVNATTGAVTVYFDDFKIGPQTVPVGVPVTDWVNAGSNVITAVGTAPVQTGNTKTVDAVWWRRVGEDMEIRLEFRQTAAGTNTAGSGDYLFQIPSGYSIDTSKLTAFGGGSITINTPSFATNSVGNYAASTATSNVEFTGGVHVFDSTRVRMGGLSVSGAGAAGAQFLGQVASWVLTQANLSMTASFKVPITGWSSNVQMSNDTDTRVVAGSFYYSAAGASVTLNTPIPFPNTAVDTHSSYSAGTYTVPVTGNYDITVMDLYPVAAQSVNFFVFKNGSSFIKIAAGSAAGSAIVGKGKVILPLKAGDTISIRPDATYTQQFASGTLGTPSFNISRLSGPSVIAATESVNARAKLTANTPFTSSQNVTFDTKDFDSHGAYNTSTGLFTVPVSGVYQVSIYCQLTTSAQSYFDLYKNGVFYATVGENNANGGSGAQGAQLVKAVAGDTLSIRGTNVSYTMIGTTGSSGGSVNFLKVGN